MSESNTNKSSETDWTYVDSLTDETIDTSDIPPLTEAFFARAKIRMPRQAVPLTLNVDADVLVWFKAQGEDYEQRLNAALRIYVEAQKAYSR